MSNNNDTELPQASPGATIEDKLNQILKREQTYVQQCTLANINAAKTSGQWIIHDPNRAEALKEIQAIITTETTKARVDEWGEFMMADLDDGLKDEMYNEYVKARVAALQKEQKQ